MKHLSLIKSRTYLSKIFGLVLLVFFAFGKNFLEEKSVVIEESLFSVGIILVGIGILGRIWSFSYISGHKNKKLITSGPYSLCRNPLYFSSFLAALGIGMCTETITIPVLIILGFLTYYPTVIKSEEEKSRKKFGEEYEIYCQKIPRFIPSSRNFVEDDNVIIATKAFRRGIGTVLFFFLTISIFEFIGMLHSIGWLKTFYEIY